MDEDRVEGSARQALGALHRLVGRLFGDRKTRVEGAAEEEIGKAQNTMGGMKDTLR
ncbi:CsbD family protein [Maritimibacter sp. 55A14]|uniref:CsbD family protein n=1 Tax=Maritimibacter sp. 55A14 TaxID=2174844 RepID=UPI000D614A76|nr:CsbD family protein [Maritimibacter sp. 55A14]PWE28407.1 CsbD family protein [Maritimibacter sp. 55A14]